MFNGGTKGVRDSESTYIRLYTYGCVSNYRIPSGYDYRVTQRRDECHSGLARRFEIHVDIVTTTEAVLLSKKIIFESRGSRSGTN